MYNSKLNSIVFDPNQNFFLQAIDENGNVKNEIDKEEHLDTLLIFIEKYLNDHHYNNYRYRQSLFNKIKDMFEKLNFHKCLNDDNDELLYKYVLKINNKAFTFTFVYNSFSHRLIVDITLIYGLSNDIFISVNRINYQDAEIIDFDKYAFSRKGSYYTFTSPENYSTAFNGTILREESFRIASEAADNLKKPLLDSQLMNFMRDKMCLYKYYCLKDDKKGLYQKEDGSIDYEKLLNDKDMMNDQNYDLDKIMVLFEGCNPRVHYYDMFNTLPNTMIEFKDLYQILSEIVIDSYLIDTFELKCYVDNMGGKISLSEDILQKINLLIYSYYATELKFAESLDKIDFKHNDPIDFYIDILNNDYDMGIEKNTVDGDINNATGTINNIIEDTNSSDINNIHYIVYNELYKKYKNINLLLHNPSFQQLFKREQHNLLLYSNFSSIFDLTTNYEDKSLYEESLIKDTEKSMFNIRKTYHIENTLENLNKIYKDYIVPIRNAVQTMNQNTQSLHDLFDSFNSQKHIMNCLGLNNQEE